MKTYLNQLFVQLTDDLDLTESQENAIKKSYNAVADWLNRNDSPLNKYDVTIYPQGSMKLGTVVKPLKTDDYDIDMVCLLQKNASLLLASQVKNLVGDRIKANGTYKTMLDSEGKRCWTLQYSDNLNFHMDILPAIPSNMSNQSIKATHKENNLYYFIPTNPHGYADWFRSRMNTHSMPYERGNIETLPDFPRKTILQKIIQLFKRHRDVVFQNDQDNAPISIIITTLVAKLYNGENDISTFFERAVNNICSQVEVRNGVYWVSNPSNPNENFADKWQNEPNKRKAFYDWIQKIATDYRTLCSVATKTDLLRLLYKMFGQAAIDTSNNTLGGFDAIVPNTLLEKSEIVPYDIQQALDVPYRQKTPWKLPSWNTVTIFATANGEIILSNELLYKGKSLSFEAKHGVQKPYRVKWQITNTGNEARSSNCLRGDFYNCDENADNIRTESTSYSGIHYVQCFIIKNNKCVAKSETFIVRII